MEEYVDPHENDANKPVNSTPGVLNLKSNPTPKKVIKKLLRITVIKYLFSILINLS